MNTNHFLSHTKRHAALTNEYAAAAREGGDIRQLPRFTPAEDSAADMIDWTLWIGVIAFTGAGFALYVWLDRK